MRLQHVFLLSALMIAGGPWSAPIGQAEIEIPPARPPVERERAIAVPPPENSPARSANPAGDSDGSDLMLFRSGDTLHGRLLGIDLESVVRWHHPDATAVIEFAPKNVVQVTFGQSPPASAPPAQAVVRLTNDDQVRGLIVSLDTGKLVLDTWYAGQLSIQRAMIASIVPKAGATTALYVGPVHEEEWQKSRHERGFEFRSGSLVSQGSGAVGRDLKLPDRARIEFDLAWRNYPYLQVAFYTDNLEQVYGNCYMLQISGTQIYLQRGRNRGFNNLGGPMNFEELQRKSRARFAVLVDKPKKSIALFIDDEMVKQWIDPGEFAGSGGGVVFQAQGQGPLRVSNIVVTEWDGEFPSADHAVVAKDQDVIRFVNNDKVSGQLKGIANGAISFVTAFATLDIPLERAAQIDFASEKAERARRQAHDVTATFHDGGRVTLALDKLDAQQLTGASENFGRLSFTRNAFKELRLHIYDETIQPSKADDEGF